MPAFAVLFEDSTTSDSESSAKSVELLKIIKDGMRTVRKSIEADGTRAAAGETFLHVNALTKHFRDATRLVSAEVNAFVDYKRHVEEEHVRDAFLLPSFSATPEAKETPKIAEQCDQLRAKFQYLLETLADLEQLGEEFKKIFAELSNECFKKETTIESELAELSNFTKELLTKQSLFVAVQPPAVVRTMVLFPITLWYFVPVGFEASVSQPELATYLLNEIDGSEVYNDFRAGLIPDQEEIKSCATLEVFIANSVDLDSANSQPLLQVTSIQFEQRGSCYSAQFFLRISSIEDKFRNCGSANLLARRDLDESFITRIGMAPALRRYCIAFSVTHLQDCATDVDENGFVDVIASPSLGISFPFCVVAHSSQHCMASACAFWTRAFGSIWADRFDFPEHVSSDKLIKFLEILFRSFLRPSKTRPFTRGLDTREMAHVAHQLSSLAHYEREDHSSVSWAMFTRFTRKQNENKTLSFWLWFYKTAELILYDKYVHQFWNDRLILGFFPKEKRGALLESMNSERGSFGLFFSDASPGAITISLLMTNDIQKEGRIVKEKTISHVEPFDLRRLKIHGLLRYIDANTRDHLVCPKRFDQELRSLLEAVKTRGESSTLPAGYKHERLFTDDNVRYDGFIVISCPDYKGSLFESTEVICDGADEKNVKTSGNAALSNMVMASDSGLSDANPDKRRAEVMTDDIHFEPL